MRCAVVCVSLVGCVPVSHSTSAARIRDAAPALRREGAAVVAVDERDDHPSEDSPTASSTEVLRLDEPVRVRLDENPGGWSFATGFDSAEQTMTVADLLADCPADLSTSEANRSAYPHCRLFHAVAIQLRHGRRAETWKMVLAGSVAAAAGDIVCIAECGKPASEVASDVGIAALGAVGAAAFLGFIVYELTKDDAHLKH